MSRTPSRFLRDNAFIVAAVALPVVVGVFFVVASAVPRWTVPLPAHDLVLRAAKPYDNVPRKVAVEFTVRDGRVAATARPVPPQQGYTQSWGLLYFDHETGTVREILMEVPDSLNPSEEERTLEIDGLTGVRVSAQTTAPDGYRLENSGSGSPGIVGSLFGIGRYRQTAALSNRGRVVRLELPSPYEAPYASSTYPVGWVLEGEAR